MNYYIIPGILNENVDSIYVLALEKAILKNNGFSIQQLRHKNRHRIRVDYLHIYFYIMKFKLKKTHFEIGNLFNRNTSTVTLGVINLSNLLNTNYLIKDLYSKILLDFKNLEENLKKNY